MCALIPPSTVSAARRVLVRPAHTCSAFVRADRLQVDEPITTTPTIGFNVETMQYKNIKFQVWDLGGQTAIRPYWRCYYPNTDAIIFVVDSADRDRIKTARTELMGMLEEEELAGATLLVFANKQDQTGAMKAPEVRRLGDARPLGLPQCPR